MLRSQVISYSMTRYYQEYSIEENSNVDYNPNLPGELRAKYVGQSWSPQVHTDICSRLPDSGYYCMGAVGDLPPYQIRFYFDIRTNSCRCFIYNGCDGNQNNFMNVDHCLEWCSPNTTIADRLTRGYTSVFAAQESECHYFY